MHGIINVLNCSLWNGATCEMLAGKFDAEQTWRTLLRPTDPVNVFMAVPTVYSNLAKHLKDGKLDDFMSRERIKQTLSA